MSATLWLASGSPRRRQLLAWSGLELPQVGGIAVGIGPGLFTGLRVGVETAKTLAQVMKVPIVGISGLDALAPPVRAGNEAGGLVELLG